MIRVPCSADDLLEVLHGRDGRRGIVRIVEEEQLRALEHVGGDLVEIDEEVRARRDGIEVRFASPSSVPPRYAR
jgi:hypothetical protein